MKNLNDAHEAQRGGQVEGGGRGGESPATGLVGPVIILAGRPAEMDTALLKGQPDVRPK